MQELLEEIVKIQVEEYNKISKDIPLHLYLTEEELEKAADYGKVDFGKRKNKKQISVEEALETMLQAFQDKLFLVIHNERECESLQSSITIKEGDVFTFIKLTLLSGRMW